MSKAEKTREFIIEKAAPIFNTKGYAGTSLTDLIDATGLTKGSIYGNFENKDEVALAVFKYQITSLGKKFDDMTAGKATAYEKINAVLEFYRTKWMSFFQKGGCPMLNASIEADDNLPFLKKHVQNSIKGWAMKFVAYIQEGIANGEFKKDTRAEEYAYLIITLIEGGIMLSKIQGDPKHLYSALDRIEKIILEEIKK